MKHRHSSGELKVFPQLPGVELCRCVVCSKLERVLITDMVPTKSHQPVTLRLDLDS
jgi:hypothetical protein